MLGRPKRDRLEAAVRLFAVPNVMDRNDFLFVIYAVDDAVVTDTDAEEVLRAC